MTGPRFSIIVPVHDVAAFVDGCLESISGQSFRDYEVIVVDDASADGSADVVERRQRRDARISLLSTPAAPRGAGPARNLGVARATGEHLMFLDGDDAFTDAGVLSALAARVAQRPGLDVLLFDYQEVRPCGLVRPVTAGRVVPGPHRAPFAVRDRPDALRTSWVCWNKAYRRQFVLERGLTFPAGSYEDFPWSISCLLTAERVDLLGRTGVDYRKCRPGSTSGQVGVSQLAVFDQIERIRSFVEQNPRCEFPGLRPLLVDSLTHFLRSRWTRKKVIPAAVLPEFHRRTRELQDWR